MSDVTGLPGLNLAGLEHHRKMAETVISHQNSATADAILALLHGAERWEKGVEALSALCESHDLLESVVTNGHANELIRLGERQDAQADGVAVLSDLVLTLEQENGRLWEAVKLLTKRVEQVEEEQRVRRTIDTYA